MSAAPLQMPPALRFYWSVRRELWENRSIYLGPLAVALVVLIGFAITLVGLPDRMRAAVTLATPEQRELIEQPYLISAIVLMLVEILVAVFYSLDALYGERRDRSILFWKSLPVSDTTAVLAKACIPILLLPLLTFMVTAGAQLIMLLASTAVLAATGVTAAPLWQHVSLGTISSVNLGHLLLFHGIWYAPLFGWLLLVSAWATRAPFLWAILPPAAIAIVERIAFNSTYFLAMVQNRLVGAPDSSSGAGEMAMTMDMLGSHDLSHFVASSGVWAGLALTAVFLAGAVRLRKTRGPL